MDPLALTLLVDFSYTSEIIISEENVQVSIPWGQAACLFVVLIKKRPSSSVVPATQLILCVVPSCRLVISLLGCHLLLLMRVECMFALFGSIIIMCPPHSYSFYDPIFYVYIQVLLPASSVLQMSTVREACCKFLMRQLHPTNCLGIRSFAGT